jgi:hypothetical protein
MKKSQSRPAYVDSAMRDLKREAHAHVVSRGLVQFRLGKEHMEKLLKIADEKGLGYGVFARMCLCECLDRMGKEKGSSGFDSRIRNIVRQELKGALITATRRKKVG